MIIAKEIARQGDTKFKGICIKNHDLNSWKKRISRRDMEAKFENNPLIPPGIWDTDLDYYHDLNGYNINFGNGYNAKIIRNTYTWNWIFKLTVPRSLHQMDIEEITFMYNNSCYKLTLEQDEYKLDLSEYDISPTNAQECHTKKTYNTFHNVIDMIRLCRDILSNN